MVAELMHQAGALLADGGGDDPWAQRITAFSAFLSALVAAGATLRAMLKSQKEASDTAVRQAQQEQDAGSQAPISDEQLARAMEIMFKRQNPGAGSGPSE